MNSAPDRLINRTKVEDLVSLPTASLYELMKHPDPEKRFPSPIKIGENRVRWSENEIQAWIERQKARAARDPG